MSYWFMSGGARLLFIVRRAYEMQKDDAFLADARHIAAQLIGAGCAKFEAANANAANAALERTGACPQLCEDSRLCAASRDLAVIRTQGSGKKQENLDAINFDSDCGACRTSFPLPVGNTGRTLEEGAV